MYDLAYQKVAFSYGTPPEVTMLSLWLSARYTSRQAMMHSYSTCIQVPGFSFREKKISGFEWGSNPHTHISGVMLYQLSYQALGSKLVGRKGIQVLVLGAHYIRN